MADRDPSFQQGKHYLGNDLAHYFNNELGAASNLLHSLKVRLQKIPDTAELVHDLEKAIACLVTVHKVGNVALDRLT